MRAENFKSSSRPLVVLAVMLMLISTLGSACDDGSKNNSVTDTGNTATDVNGDANGDATVTNSDVTSNGDVDTVGCGTSVDTDNDGIADAYEDLNQDCVVDAGETAWNNPDTDGDTLSDGDEVAGGYFDPLKADTNDDGVPDSEDPMAAVCVKSVLRPYVAGPAPHAQSTLALPEGFKPLAQQQQLQAASAMAFDDGKIFGFVTRRTGTNAQVLAEHSANLVALSVGGYPPLVELTDPEFTTWSALDAPARRAIRAHVRFELSAATDVARVRDGLVGALQKVAVDTSAAVTGTTCANIIYWQVTELRDDLSVVTVGALACEADFDDAARLTFDDLTNTTNFAVSISPNKLFKANEDPTCEAIDARSGGGAVDILWVIDNSGSMADELDNVARTAATFLTTLQNSGTDWRLGVTTTEAYLIWENPARLSITNGAPDPMLDMVDGLRGGVFLDKNTVNVADAFDTLVTFWDGCYKELLNPPPPVGTNICGFGLESGLKSGRDVLAATQLETADDRILRADAAKLVVWIGDEDDEYTKSEGDAATIAAPYVALGVVGCAIVGDGGPSAGGVCQPLGTQTWAVTGANLGQGYIDVALATGGLFGSLCNDDLTETIDGCIKRILIKANNYQLSHWPLSSTIKVAIDGEIVPRSKTNGWDYDMIENALVFTGDALQLDSVITVSYRVWVKNEG